MVARKDGKVRKDCKCKPKYIKQLLNGLRRDGLSIEEVCQLWGVLPRTYYRWVELYPEFTEAHEAGARDNMIWWQQLGRRGIAGEFRLNAAAYNFTMSNLHGWNNKVVTETTAQDEIRTININVLPSREQNALAHQPEIIDVEATSKD